MAVPVAAILYKLRTMYSSLKFEIKPSVPAGSYVLYVYRQGKLIGSKSFAPDTPMDKFWVDIKDWMRTIVR